MITHYGLFWKERDVFWGRQKNPGRLLGRVRTPLGRAGAPTRRERADAEDFRHYVGLYCLYGGGELLYVGQAGVRQGGDLFSRIRSHKKGPMSDRWDTFSWFGRPECEGQCDVKAALKQLEAISIAIINPGFNKQSGEFDEARQVFQVPDEQAEGDIETKLARMAETLARIEKK